MTKEPIYVVDIFGGIVTEVSNAITPRLQLVQPGIVKINYLVGHVTEIKERLTSMQKTPSLQNQAYPLVALFQDFVENRGNDNGYYGTVNLQAVILYYTQKTDYTEDRYTKVFKPILYPIYEELLRQVVRSGWFVLNDPKDLPHDKIDRPRWGKPAENRSEGYILSDSLDGIELRNLKLKINKPLYLKS